MLASEHSGQAAMAVRGSGDVVQGVLDVLPVTDNVYHHLAYTRPLVDALLTEVRSFAPAGRVLVIGPNELLPQVLAELGYEVDLWVLEGLPLSEEMQRRASRSGPLDEILGSPSEQLADVILVPYVAEAASAEPAQLLAMIRASVKSSGRVIMACRQPGELRRRFRRLLRNQKVAIPPDEALPPSPTWPTLHARRLLTTRDLVRAGEGQFAAVRTGLVIDHRASLTIQAQSLSRWLIKEALQLGKVVVPAFRDCSMVTFAPAGNAQPGAR